MGFIVISLQTLGLAVAILAACAFFIYVYLLAVYYLSEFLKRCREKKAARELFVNIEEYRNDFV